MAVIKYKEKKLKKRAEPSMKSTSAKVRKKLSRPQDTQPIATVAV